MAGIKRLKDYFFQITSVMRTDGTIGGVRLRKGDKPTQQTMEDLLASSTFSKESSDRSKIYTGSTDLGTEQGLVVLATDNQAKTNASQLSDRSLVLQPHQNNTVENSTGNQDSIDNDINDFVGDALSIAPDATSTRNRYIAKLSEPFKVWMTGVLNTIQTQLNGIVGKYIPLVGTSVGEPVTGAVEFTADASFYADAGGGSISEYKLFNNTPLFGPPWNNIRTYMVGSGTPDQPEFFSGYYQSRDTHLLRSTIGTGTTNEAVMQLQASSGDSQVNLYTIGGRGIGVKTTLSGYYARLKSDNVTGADKTFQFQNRSGTLALLDDIVVGDKYNTTSITPNTLDIGNGNKVFTVDSNLAYKYGDRVRASVTGQLTSFLEGHIVAYSGTTLTMSVDSAGGSGFGSPTGASFNDWQITRGGVSHLTTNINFANTQFTGGTAPTVTNSYLTYTKFGNMVFGQIFISYTGGSGNYTTISVSLPANSGLSPYGLFVGCGFCFTNQTNTIQLQVNTFTTSNGGFAIFPSNSGPDIQSGTFNISGTVIYPVSVS